MRFEERELKSCAAPVTPNLLTEGGVYFSLQFADEDMLIPIMETWVFAGRKLDPADAEGHLYFQDLESYRQGIRYDSAAAQYDSSNALQAKSANHIFEYERALDQLMLCSLRRRKASH